MTLSKIVSFHTQFQPSDRDLLNLNKDATLFLLNGLETTNDVQTFTKRYSSSNTTKPK